MIEFSQDKASRVSYERVTRSVVQHFSNLCENISPTLRTHKSSLHQTEINQRFGFFLLTKAVSKLEVMSSQGSKLAQIQMRYQQKQMQEISQKKSEAFDDSLKLSSSLGAGKVRAMFDERRHRITAGIDKSYLLEPITVETKTTTTKRVIAPTKPTRYDQKMSNYSKVIVPPLQNRIINHDINGNNHFSGNDEQLDKSFRAEVKSGGKPSGTITTTKTLVTRKLTPAVTSPPSMKIVTNQSKPSPVRSLKSGNSVASSTNSTRSMISPKKTSVPKLTQQMEKTSISSAQNSFDEDAPIPEGLIRCGICKRNFAEDRIEKHQVICQKTKVKKRKIYDASKKRVQGTEAETYLKKPISAARAAPKAVSTTAPKASNWRSKHEDFIKAIRAAKEMQAHLAKGGKLSDLPPPPPSENLDYVQCPHCSRRFNEGAAARHIPLCQNMQHNKPKPKPSNSMAGKSSTSFTKRR